MDTLDKIQKGEYTSLRKNEASRWVASDILVGNNSRKELVAGLLQSANNEGEGGPPEEALRSLKKDEMRIKNMRDELFRLQNHRINTPAEVNLYAKQKTMNGYDTFNSNQDMPMQTYPASVTSQPQPMVQTNISLGANPSSLEIQEKIR